MGARARGARGPLPAVHGHAAPALRGIEYELPVASRAGEVVRAARRAARRRPRRRWSSPRRAATTRSGCCCAAASPSRATATAVTVGQVDELELERHPRPRRPVVGRLPRRRRRARPRLADRRRRRGGQLDARRLLRASSSAWAASSSAPLEDARRRADRRRAGVRARRRARRRCRAPSSSPTRCRWPSTSCRWWRCSAASPRARPSCAAPRSCASRSPTGSPPWSTACAAWAPTSRRPRTASPCAGRAACAAASLDAHGDHRLAMLGAVAGLASREGVEVVGMEAAAVSLPGLRRDDLAALLARLSREALATLGHGDRDRRPRRGRQVHRGPRRRRRGSASPTWTPGRCTAASRWRPADRAEPAAAARRGPADRVRRRPRAARRPRRHRGDPHARGRRRPRRGSPPTRRCARRSCAKQRELLPTGDWVAEGRDIGTVVAPGRRGQGVPDRLPEERARRRAGELGARRRRRAARAGPARRARPSGASRPLRARRDAVDVDTTGPDARRGRRRGSPRSRWRPRR